MNMKPGRNMTDQEAAGMPHDVLAKVLATIAGLAAATTIVAVLTWLDGWLDKLINLIF